MSDTIDVGIDLGTTNSAVAVAAGGRVTVVKNNDNADTTPSAVWLPRADTVYVGQRARKRAETDPDNTATEFKQLMGYEGTAMRFVRAEVELNPEQLSAEVLKSLRHNVASALGEPPDAAVITVPAAFALNQRNATLRAAELAGLGKGCPLVQEPVAAAFAFGLREQAGRGRWLVFDFGGGTFDAAVLYRDDEELQVLHHAGDRSLGGKLIDWALVDRVLAPAVAQELGLKDFTRSVRRWRGNFARLKAAAEQAKIDLSQNESAELIIELVVDGQEETFEVTLPREALDVVAEPFYVRAIELAKSALAESDLQTEHLDRVLLVGGTTLAPGLRERLADPVIGLGAPLDFSADPTTVVAHGAALFASTVRRPRRSAPARRPGGFALEMTHEPTVTVTDPVVAGRVHGDPVGPWAKYAVELGNPDARPPFRSGRIALNANGAFTCEVDIDPRQTSRFRVALFDGSGTECSLEPGTFTITHRAGPEFEGVRLADSLGVQHADGGFSVVVRKGVTLPALGHRTFKTSGALRRTELDAVLRIPVAEGERSRGERNRQVGMLEVRSADITVDLPMGSDVEVTFEIDVSGMVSVVADVPAVEIQTDAVINLDGVAAPTPPQLREQLREIEQRLFLLRNSAHLAPQAEQLLQTFDRQGTLTTAHEQVAASDTSPDAAVAAEDRLRDAHAELDDVADALAVPELVRDLDERLGYVEMRVHQIGTERDRHRLTDLRARAEDAIETRNSKALRKQLDEASEYHVDLVRRSPDFPVVLFHSLEDALRSTPEAAGLLREGGRVIAAGEHWQLTLINHRLLLLLPPNLRDPAIGIL
ncbi:Hsp70 family protein [Nocardia sp. BMG111209]|uniref:Hsp70 family protein n=1 Tax=Nocardia sp. BMG111209 TaxID=1160137 RepID=UPI0003753621|nr:Hsp70 family protein [Nocardia sp. BMG111209]